MKTKIIVVDLDGTLMDCGHRQHHAQNKDWDQFHAGIPMDEPNGDVLFVLDVFSKAAENEPIYIVACTGRPEKYRQVTMECFFNHSIPIDVLLMRPDFDFGSDASVKINLLQDFLEKNEYTNENVVMILEDRDRMVEAWREAGFNCWQVRPGSY